MHDEQVRKGQIFRDLHLADEIFVMPNAWDAGSACLLEAADFPAIGTTSAGIAYFSALPDYEGALTREDALEQTCLITNAVNVPVSADAENGYGHTPEEVAETIRLVAQTGAVGASIEDYATSYGTGKLYERDHAVEIIKAARSAADSLGFPFTLTARAECYWVDHATPFDESRRSRKPLSRRRPFTAAHGQGEIAGVLNLKQVLPATGLMRNSRRFRLSVRAIVPREMSGLGQPPSRPLGDVHERNNFRSDLRRLRDPRPSNSPLPIWIGAHGASSRNGNNCTFSLLVIGRYPTEELRQFDRTTFP